MEPLAGDVAHTHKLRGLWAAPFAAFLAFGMVVTATEARFHPHHHRSSATSGASVHHRLRSVLPIRRGPPFSRSVRSTTVLQNSAPSPPRLKHSPSAIMSARPSKIRPVRLHRGRALYSATPPSIEPQPAGQDERAILTYSVDGVDDGQVVVIVRHGDVLMPLAEGVTVTAGAIGVVTVTELLPLAVE